MSVELNPGPSQLASPSRVGAYLGCSREWARKLLREWYDEQQHGGPVRALRKGKVLYTTMAVLQQHAPRGRDERVYRMLAEHEKAIEAAFARIAELEQRIGRRR